jgi:hypothetical protein
MRLRRGPREVYRVYGEDEAPDVDEWSGAQAPTRELAIEHPQAEMSTPGLDAERRWPEAPARETGSEPSPRPSDEPRFTRLPARLGQARRVAVMTLLGVGVGLVAALAIHSLRGSAVVDGRRAGQAGQGAALWPSTSPSVPIAVVPARAHPPRTVRASPVHVAAVHPPHGHSKEHKSAARHAASAVYTAAYPAVYTAAATPSEGTAEVQAPAEAASEFTFER